MADPTVPVATAAAAGLGAAFVTWVGLEPQALVWGLVGAIFGVPLAPPAGRWRTVAVFLAVVCACAMLGTWAAEHFHGGSRMARNGWAMVLAAVFHPALAALVQAVPAVLQAFLKARTGGQQQ